LCSGYELWRLRLFSFCGYGLALAALALEVFGTHDSYPKDGRQKVEDQRGEIQPFNFSASYQEAVHFLTISAK